MRKRQREILKAYFYTQLITTRAALKLTQSQMAEKLSMDDRSYIDLDHGKTCCKCDHIGPVPDLCVRITNKILGGSAPCF